MRNTSLPIEIQKEPYLFLSWLYAVCYEENSTSFLYSADFMHSAFLSVRWQLHRNSVMAQEDRAKNHNSFQFTVQIQGILLKMPILEHGSACGRLLVFL